MSFVLPQCCLGFGDLWSLRQPFCCCVSCRSLCVWLVCQYVLFLKSVFYLSLYSGRKPRLGICFLSGSAFLLPRILFHTDKWQTGREGLSPRNKDQGTGLESIVVPLTANYKTDADDACASAIHGRNQPVHSNITLFFPTHNTEHGNNKGKTASDSNWIVDCGMPSKDHSNAILNLQWTLETVALLRLLGSLYRSREWILLQPADSLLRGRHRGKRMSNQSVSPSHCHCLLETGMAMVSARQSFRCPPIMVLGKEEAFSLLQENQRHQDKQQKTPHCPFKSFK